MLQPIREYMCFGMRRNISDPVFVHVVAFFVWHVEIKPVWIIR